MPPLNQYQKWIELEIKKQKYGKQPLSLYEPITYIMSLGGKRLRPLLTLLSYSLFKDDVKSIVPFAVAVEAFHNFTLMHDDIMDEAPLRRGKETVHERWDVNTAILSGDVMLVKVYEMFLKAEPEKIKSILSAFSKCASQVCEGQQWDMEFESKPKVTEAQYINMIKLKTAVLLGFSMELGALLAGADATSQKVVRDFGINIGIGFQLKDDLLDAFGDPKKFGKQVGGDILANKKTLLLIQAQQKAQGKTKDELESWLSAKLYKKPEKIKAVKNIYESLRIPTSVQNKVNQYFKRGFENLEKIEGNPAAKALLKKFTETLIQRQS
jgi:geranylgeranyl diphosphate synthase, type II